MIIWDMGRTDSVRFSLSSFPPRSLWSPFEVQVVVPVITVHLALNLWFDRFLWNTYSRVYIYFLHVGFWLFFGFVKLYYCCAGRQKQALRLGQINSVAVVVCNKNEGPQLVSTMESLKLAGERSFFAENNISVKLVLVDGGSPQAERDSVKHLVTETWHIQGGKLFQRHFASMKETADVIVSCDSDTCYNPEFLEAMIRPFVEQPARVVGTVTSQYCARPLMPNDSPFTRVPFPFWGGGNAYRTEVYKSCPFQLNFEQSYFVWIWAEEEFSWPFKMMQYGDLVVAPTKCQTHWPGNWEILKRWLYINRFNGGLLSHQKMNA